MSTILSTSLREDLHARFDADLGSQLVDRVLDQKLEAAKNAVSFFRTVLVEREAVAELAERAGLADLHVLRAGDDEPAAAVAA